MAYDNDSPSSDLQPGDPLASGQRSYLPGLCSSNNPNHRCSTPCRAAVSYDWLDTAPFDVPAFLDYLAKHPW